MNVVLVYRKEVAAILFAKMYLNIPVQPETITKIIIYLPAKTIIFCSGHYAQQSRITEKVFGNIVYVERKFHNIIISLLLLSRVIKRQNYSFKIPRQTPVLWCLLKHEVLFCRLFYNAAGPAYKFAHLRICNPLAE